MSRLHARGAALAQRPSPAATFAAEKESLPCGRIDLAARLTYEIDRRQRRGDGRDGPAPRTSEGSIRSRHNPGSSYENRANVAASWLDANLKVFEGTGFGRQEIDGEILEEMPGALFKREWLERSWSPDAHRDSPFRRVGVGVDPAETSGEKADNWGIIAAGIREDGILQVLEDATVNASPDVAAKAAVALDWKHGASFMVADLGRSGAMVDSMMRLVDPRVKVLKKGGNKGRRAWAESVAVLYSKHLVFHSAGLGKLEDSAASGRTM